MPTNPNAAAQAAARRKPAKKTDTVGAVTRAIKSIPSIPGGLRSGKGMVANAEATANRKVFSKSDEGTATKAYLISQGTSVADANGLFNRKSVPGSKVTVQVPKDKKFLDKITQYHATKGKSGF